MWNKLQGKFHLDSFQNNATPQSTDQSLISPHSKQRKLVHPRFSISPGLFRRFSSAMLRSHQTWLVGQFPIYRWFSPKKSSYKAINLHLQRIFPALNLHLQRMISQPALKTPGSDTLRTPSLGPFRRCAGMCQDGCEGAPEWTAEGGRRYITSKHGRLMYTLIIHRANTRYIV